MPSRARGDFPTKGPRDKDKDRSKRPRAHSAHVAAPRPGEEYKRQRREELQRLMAQSTCRKCNKPGHWARECPGDKGPREQRGTPHQSLVTQPGQAELSADAWQAFYEDLLSRQLEEPQERPQRVKKGRSQARVHFGESREANSGAPERIHSGFMVGSGEPGSGDPKRVLGTLGRGTHEVQADPQKLALWSSAELQRAVIVDVGCIRSVTGTMWMEETLQRLQSRGLPYRIHREADKFKFGDGEVQTSQYSVTFLAGFQEKVCWLRFSVVPGNCPPRF
jgi:hypothetical protein